jgi:hypothetical protein
VKAFLNKYEDFKKIIWLFEDIFREIEAFSMIVRLFSQCLCGFYIVLLFGHFIWPHDNKVLQSPVAFIKPIAADAILP